MECQAKNQKNYFVPEFGPNGAVMNSPHMTDEVRDKIKNPWKTDRKVSVSRSRFFDMFFALMFVKFGYEIPKHYPNVSEEQAYFYWSIAFGCCALIGLVEFCWWRYAIYKKRANQD